MPSRNATPDRYRTKAIDFVGVGFGPTNVSVAIALEELRPDLSSTFFEMQDRFGWHRGLLLHGATMQVSFLKDLVSFRNPQSRFSFTSFLHQKERLADFANLKSFFPSRVEFHQYLEWCAEHFTDQVNYAETVERIGLNELHHGTTPTFVVETSGPKGKSRVEARSVIYAGGLEPNLPLGLAGKAGIIHTSALLQEITRLKPGSRVAVVGAGQSATEAVSYLYDTIGQSTIHAVVPRFGYSPADDSPFVNQIFDPDHVDHFFNATPQTRQKILALHASTNYSAVDLADIEGLYRRWYADRMTGSGRLHMHRMSRLIDVRETLNGVVAIIRDELNQTTRHLELDAVVCATGYRPRDVRGLLDERSRSLLRTDGKGGIEVDRLYRAEFDLPRFPSLYIPDMCEMTHGLSATLISNMAVRAGEIVDSLPRLEAPLQLSEVA